MTVSIGQWLGCLHRPDRCLSTQFIPNRGSIRFMFEDQVFQFTALPFGMSPSPWIFAKLMDIIAAHLHQRSILLFPNWQQTNISYNILPSNVAKSRVHYKSKEVRFDTSPEIHLYRDGISDTTKRSQGTNRPHWISTSNYQTFFLRLKFWHNFSFLFWANLVQQQTSFMTATIVSLICLETPYSSSRLSGSDQQYDLISFEMVDDTSRLVLGTSIHPQDPSAFLFTDASHYG